MMLRSLRSLFNTGVALLDLAAALKGCPVEPHPVILVEETPIVLSTLVCSDTALTFGSITIDVTSAPTLLITSFNAITTSTLHDGRYDDSWSSLMKFYSHESLVIPLHPLPDLGLP